MEYNPLNHYYNALNTILAKLNASKSARLEELSWYDNTDVETLKQALQDNVYKIEKKKSQLVSIGDAVSALHIKVKETEKHIKTMFNPKNWFSSKQQKFRKERKKLNKTILRKAEQKQNELGAVKTLNRRSNGLKSSISKYEDFDFQEKTRAFDAVINEISLYQKKSEILAEQKEKVDVALSPIITEMEKMKSEKQAAEKTILRAQDYQRKLSAYEGDYKGNSYKRAKIHQQCANELQNGKPWKIIEQQEKTIEYIDRNYSKFRDRAIETGKRADVAHITHTVIIDGNNMCYENGNEYVGLSPLKKVTAELEKRYKVTVVFDAAIRSMLKSSDDGIAAQFTDNINIHIVASRRLADETILDSASDNKGIYIISNDRFREYTDKDAVKHNRVIRHEILNGSVFISGLDIKASYN